MGETFTNAPVIVVGIMIGVDIALRVLDKIGKLKERHNTPTLENIPAIEVEIPKTLLRQCEDTYWKTVDIYRHAKESIKMLEKIKEKLPHGFDKIAELMQEILLELKKISKEVNESKSSGD